MNGFAQWASRYASIFGLTAPGDGPMVASWQALFDAAGYSSAELEEATDWLSQQAGPMTRPEHRPAIQARVRQRRIERHRLLAEQAERSEQKPCSLCGGSGQVIVPDPRSVTDGEWDGSRSGGRLYTCSVSCSCPPGQRIANSYRIPESEKSDSNRKRPKLLTLADYEKMNPNWAQQLLWHDRELRARASSDVLARAAEKQLPVGESIDRILARPQLRLKGPE